MGMIHEIMPCPFCGSHDVDVKEGETFRWRIVVCNCCGAAGPDVRIQTAGSGTNEEWDRRAAVGAVTEWNKRHNAETGEHGMPSSTKQYAPSPSVCEGGKTYLKHDAVRIAQQSKGIVLVELLWMGKPVHLMQAECDFQAEQTLTLNGIEGRMEIKIVDN